MANLEKHKTNPLQEWLADELSEIPAQPRGSRMLGTHLKKPKAAVSPKFRPVVGSQPEPKLEPAQVREAAPPPRSEEKHSQASSREHLLKSERLPNLRAPVTYKTATPLRVAVAKPAARAIRTPARRAAPGRTIR
jgi:hypothetical protein